MNNLDKYGSVDDHVEPLDDGIYYRVDDVDYEMSRLYDSLARSMAQTDEALEMVRGCLE